MTGLLPKVADRVQETTSTTGTGALTLAGAAGPQQSFVNGIGLGTLTSYAILSGDNVGWEINTGTLSGSGPYVLSRGTPSASSNGGSLVALSGVSTVFCDISAAFVGLLQTTFQNNGTVQNVNTLNVSNGLTASATGQVLTLTASGGGIFQSGTVASSFSTLEISGSLAGSVTSGILTLNGTGITSGLGIQLNGTVESITTLNFANNFQGIVSGGTLSLSTPVSGTPPTIVQVAADNSGAAGVVFSSAPTIGNYLVAINFNAASQTPATGWTIQVEVITGTDFGQILTKRAGASESTTQNCLSGSTSPGCTVMWELSGATTGFVIGSSMAEQTTGVSNATGIFGNVKNMIALAACGLVQISGSPTITNMYGMTQDELLNSGSGTRAIVGGHSTILTTPIAQMITYFSSSSSSDKSAICLISA